MNKCEKCPTDRLITEIIEHGFMGDSGHVEGFKAFIELWARALRYEAELAKHELIIEDLSMLIRRMASGADVLGKTVDYLSRKGLLGSPLREVTLPEKARPSIKPDSRCDGCGTAPPSRCTEGDCPVFLEIKDEKDTFLPECKRQKKNGSRVLCESLTVNAIECSKNCKFAEPKKDEVGNG